MFEEFLGTLAALMGAVAYLMYQRPRWQVWVVSIFMALAGGFCVDVLLN